jgi:serine/threonine-protein phosphatase 2A activator
MTAEFTSFPQVERDASFGRPAKLINSDADVVRFNASVAFDRIVGFLLLLNQAVQGRNLDEHIPLSPTIEAIGDVLDKLNMWVDGIPPSSGPRRFGNVAFREWMKRVEEVDFWQNC